MMAATPIGGVIGLGAWTRFSHAAEIRWVGPLWIALLVLIAPDPRPLAWTMGVEAVVVLAFAMKLGLEPLRLVVASAFTNAITQPCLYLSLPLIPMAGGENWLLATAIAELLVCLVEAFLYWGLLPELRRSGRSARDSFAISLTANAASFLVGLALPS